MNREDFNIEVQENSGETPYVEETVFRKKPLILETKKREPIFDFVKENGAEVAVRREEKTEDAPLPPPSAHPLPALPPLLG